MYCMIFPAYYIIITSYGTLQETLLYKTIAKTNWIQIKRVSKHKYWILLK